MLRKFDKRGAKIWHSRTGRLADNVRNGRDIYRHTDM